MVEDWYIEELDGSIVGPRSEQQVREELFRGEIPGNLRVRQGNGPWCSAQRVSDLFRQLADGGWYIQDDRGQSYGPFTPDRLLALHEAGEIGPDFLIRQGCQGDWNPAQNYFAMGANNLDSDIVAAGTSNPKWSVEPLRHYMLSIESAVTNRVNACHDLERLFFRSNAASSIHLHVERSNGQEIGRLNRANSTQLLANSRRGIRHIALFGGVEFAPQIVVILCPPGTKRESCHQYVEANFART